MASPGDWLRRLVGWVTGYASTDPANRVHLEGWSPAEGTHDQILAPSLLAIVAQCRQLDRTSPKARATVEGFRSDVIGSGIGIEPDTGDRLLDARLRTSFNAWAESAGISGESLWELQYQAAGEVCTAGAFLWRWVEEPTAAGIRLRLLPLEVEWLSPDPLRKVDPALWVHGKVLDHLGRPVEFHLVNPDTGASEIVPASDIVHGYIRRRARQSHGEPELASLVVRFLQDDRVIVTELRAALNTAAVSGVIETEDADLLIGGSATTGATTGATPRRRLEPGTVLSLRPGEKWSTVENKRPAQGIKDFRATIDGDIAGGAGVSRQWLDRDSGRANYSSSREDNQRTERRLGPTRATLGRHCAGVVYERVLPLLLVQLGVRIPSDPRERARLMRYELRPDRPEYVDPMKDALAIDFQISKNLTTLEEALAGRGRDVETVLAKRAAEIRRQDEQAVERVKHLAELAAAAGVEGLTWAHLVTLQGASTAPGAYLDAAASPEPQANP
jgi:lambda family phage portal protein